MRTRVQIEPNLQRLMGESFLNGERAVTRAMRSAQGQLKTAWRTQITSAGLGRKLANTVRGAAYPKGTDSMNAAALVWSKAPHIVGAHDGGVLVRSADGFWLAIPTPAAGRGRRGARMTPLSWERRNGLPLRFVYRPNGNALLVADDARVSKRGLARRKGGRRRKSDGILTGAQTVVIFILVPQVRLKKRLDLSRDAERIATALPGMIVGNWRD